MKVREFFENGELVCHCGCGLLPPVESVERLYALRTILGIPLPISSASRCKEHNKASGGKRGSIHLPPKYRIGESGNWGGQGFDIIAQPNLQADILAIGLKVGFRGFGFGNTFIHIDDANRPQISFWRY